MTMSYSTLRVVFSLIVVFSLLVTDVFADDFRITPYVQNPAPDAMTLMWFTHGNVGGTVTYNSGGSLITVTSTPVLAGALAYHANEVALLPGGTAPPVPYLHEVRLTGLATGTQYDYTVHQGGTTFDSAFKTAPGANDPIRLIVFADSETEPESTGKKGVWTDPSGAIPNRTYIVDQTVGFTENLRVIKARNPDLLLYAGDLVESGGEQRDWDEFWKHNTNADYGIGSTTPILPALGNHEYFGGPGAFGGYNQPGAERGPAKYATYFDVPENDSANVNQKERYYRLDYGPVSIIVLDVANGSPNGSQQDTNWTLLGENDADGGHAPDFNPGSVQYQWLQQQLEDAQQNSQFTFVMFHHVPYSVGPHGVTPGNPDQQSGVPVRVLTPLFMQYGVDAVFAGHDEMFERSLLEGVEVIDGGTRAHSIHFIDVGVAGDDLRGPISGLVNPYQEFLAHVDSPELYTDGLLTDGGKHYGHLEVNVYQIADGWEAELTPVYVFPILERNAQNQIVVTGWERRVYSDIVHVQNITPTADDGDGGDDTGDDSTGTDDGSDSPGASGSGGDGALPEPATMLLLVPAMLAITQRRRK